MSLQHSNQSNNSGVTSEFLRHEPCPRCGSNDNLGVYSDHHVYCFGCGYFSCNPRFSNLTHFQEKVKSNLKSLPEDTQKQIGVKGWQWLKKYGIMESECSNFLWSDSKEWLIYTVRDSERELLMWQARTFNGVDRKYLTFGPASDILNIIGTPTNNKIILCEDILSSIKIGRFCESMCLWGSNIPLKTLTRLATRFKRLGIWLDSDKAKESLKSNRRASQLGFEVQTIITTKDPKEYENPEIRSIIESG